MLSALLVTAAEVRGTKPCAVTPYSAKTCAIHIEALNPHQALRSLSTALGKQGTMHCVPHGDCAFPFPLRLLATGPSAWM